MTQSPERTREVTRADIEAAREVLTDVSRLTPVEGSRPLSERVGGPVLLKCENLQRAGSFKIRGAYVRISRLSDDERKHGENCELGIPGEEEEWGVHPARV